MKNKIDTHTTNYLKFLKICEMFAVITICTTIYKNEEITFYMRFLIECAKIWLFFQEKLIDGFFCFNFTFMGLVSHIFV